MAPIQLMADIRAIAPRGSQRNPFVDHYVPQGEVASDLRFSLGQHWRWLPAALRDFKARPPIAEAGPQPVGNVLTVLHAVASAPRASSN